MRETKFRFWHKILRRMSKPHGLGVIWEYLCEEWGGPFNWTDVEKLQYTGRHDKNGVEICEGDIFGNLAALRCVIRRLDDGAYKLVFCDTRITPWSITDPRVRKSEVIGNVWEHPELLEGA